MAKLDENQQFSEQTLIQTLYAWAKRVAQKVNRMSGSEFTATYDPPNLLAMTGVTTTVTATGAAMGDYVQATFSLDTQGIVLHAWVSSADTVSVSFWNHLGMAVNLGEGTLKVTVSPE